MIHQLCEVFLKFELNYIEKLNAETREVSTIGSRQLSLFLFFLET